MKHYGDITKLNGYELPIVDVITGGSPCQDLSVAGKREGLNGERSGLFMEQIRIVKEMREHDKANGRSNEYIRPRYMVWENVPGAFSSNQGKDFQSVLTEIVKIVEQKSPDVPLPDRGGWRKSGCIYDEMGRWSVAWRVHDAQFWGVPQRRKRIALVADFGGQSAPEILFERKGLSGNITESGKEREATSKTVGRGIEEAGGCLNSWDVQSKRIFSQDGVCHTLNSGTTEGMNIVPSVCLNPWDVQSKHIQTENGIAETLYSGECRYGGGESYVMQQTVYGISAFESNSMKSNNPHSGIYEAETSRTLDLNGGNPACNQGGMAIVCATTEMTPKTDEKGIEFSLRSRDYKDPQVVAYGLDRAAYNQGQNAKYNFAVDEEKIGCQTSRGPGAVYQHIVRRLTPMECERLQGYPDGWTDIGEWVNSNGKKHKDADSPRYRALGNSIALPFWQYLARRICAQYERDITMGSLFDGIGGFPYVFERCGAKAVWASEIEEFPIAVTKKHFPENNS